MSSDAVLREGQIVTGPLFNAFKTEQSIDVVSRPSNDSKLPAKPESAVGMPFGVAVLTSAL